MSKDADTQWREVANTLAEALDRLYQITGQPVSESEWTEAVNSAVDALAAYEKARNDEAETVEIPSLLRLH